MARGSSQATTAADTSQGLGTTYSSNAGNLFSDLAPQLEAEAAHPAGMSPTDIAAANTAGQQSGGGSTAGAVGQGLLRAARTRNAGGADAAIASSARSGSEASSRTALGTQLANSKLKEQQQQAGLTGLGNLFAENLTGGNQALGQVAGDVNANTNAENASWDWAKDLFDPLMGAAGSASGQIAKAFKP